MVSYSVWDQFLKKTPTSFS